MNLLVIQSSDRDPAGVVGDFIESNGGRLHIYRPTQSQTLPETDDGFDGLIVLGGAMSAWEDESYPHLRQTVHLIQQFHTEHKPILGICLGAQLIARAFGGRGYRHTVPEIGFSPVFRVDHSATESWLAHCPEPLHVMQWHFDTFDLPRDATLLMSSAVCPNQAYRIGDQVYGFQFHFEVNEAIVRSWLSLRNETIDALYPNLEQSLTQQLEHYLAASIHFAQQFSQAWLERVRQRQRVSSKIG